jgi:hypothetical protein
MVIIIMSGKLITSLMGTVVLASAQEEAQRFKQLTDHFDPTSVSTF